MDRLLTDEERYAVLDTAKETPYTPSLALCKAQDAKTAHQVAQEIFEELERADLIRTEDCGAELWVHEYPLLKDRWLK